MCAMWLVGRVVLRMPIQLQTPQTFCRKVREFAGGVANKTGGAPLSCAVFAKSRFSLIRTINTPEASSIASGFSSIGFHLSVPGMRPCVQSTHGTCRHIVLD